jgi:hypothetical protein
MKENHENRKAVLTAYVKVELKDKAALAAQADGRSMSSFIAEALIDRIARTKSVKAQGSAVDD